MRAETLGRNGARGALLLLMLSAAPALATAANDLCAANADPCVVATAVAVTANSVIDVGARELRINSGGALDVGSGTMTIKAGRLTVNANGFIRASGTSANSGGTLDIEVTGPVMVSGSLNANGAPGGTINLTSSGAVTISGTTTTPGITARALSTSEVGGTVNVTAASVDFPGVISVFGGFDALGGDVSITTTGSQNITGTIDSTGGDGGSIDLEAGAMPGAGNVVIGSSAVLKVDATIGGGFGGTLDVGARGDGVQTGHVTIEGVLTATGKTGGEEDGGGAGGCVTITADGNVTNSRAAASINAAGGGPDGDGGEVEITTNHGTIVLTGTVDSGSAGPESSGGSTSIDAFLDATINGVLTSTGGDGGGGEVDVSSDTASVSIARTAVIDVDSTAAGSGGAISLSSGVGATSPRSVVVEGALSANGGANGGSGGTIELDGDDSVRVAATAGLHADGALGGGGGGTITVDVSSGPALLDASMTAAGASPAGAGGVIAVDASQRIVLTGRTDAHGFGAGGEIGLSSTGAVDVRGNLRADSSGGGGGKIEIVSDGAVTIASSLIADGTALPGARIDILGCDVTICGQDSPACPSGGTGILSSLGPEGQNRITGRDAAVVLGTMRANTNTGHNVFLYDGDPEREPFIRIGTITPPAEVTATDEVQACPACGNANIEPPETCDDGNELDGDGCSATCQTEAPIAGDANGDFTLTPADREFAVAEIFDGDGDTVGTVSGGSFSGGVGVDANDDGVVTAADLVAITRLLAP
jgi:cysteine-rich repeat protein